MGEADDGWRPVRLFGTHLYMVPEDLDLDAIESFPPEGGQRIDSIASSSTDEDERREEYERAADRFARELERLEEQGELGRGKIVVAIGEGERFSIASWETFRETYGDRLD